MTFKPRLKYITLYKYKSFNIMPDHFPLKDEIWVEREASPRGKESTPNRIDIAMDRGDICASRGKVLGVSGTNVTYMIPGNETGHR